MDTTPQDPNTKSARYADLEQQLRSVLEGISDPIVTMSTAACLVHEALDQATWTGFYRVVAPDLLRIGPYQGPLGCLEIPFGRGVCGAAARTGATQLVEDVHAFPGHIACDAAARSEVVLPIRDPSGQIAAVFDIDSHDPAAFDAEDQQGLERIVVVIEQHWK